MGKFNSLPKEIVFEIFSRLPVESVLDCKLVCKPWRDAVNHPLFSQVQLDYQLQFGKLSFLFTLDPPIRNFGIQEHYYAEYDDIDEETLVSIETIKNYHFIKHEILQNSYLVGSSNGLLCFNIILKEDLIGSRHYGPACICNPVTREYIMLPESKGYFIGGFGYCPSTDKYKVVRVHDFVKDSNAPLLQVYTLGSGNGWRNVGKMDMSMKHPRTVGVCVNGALYWLDYEGTVIIAFHLADEKFTEISAPPPFLTARAPCAYSLMALGDFLIATYENFTDHCNEVWLLKKNNDNFGWNKELSLDIEVYWCPIGFTKSGRLLSWEKGSGFCSYDTKASSAKMLLNSGLEWEFVSGPVHHKNTFVSLKVLGEGDTRTIEFGERASSSKEAENSTDKPEDAAE